ncbi:MAG: hypothetical protein ABIX37_10615 [Gammaproteobacteria bacterium]
MSKPIAATAERKLGSFFLMPDISRVNGASYFLSVMIAVPILAALSFPQPFMVRIIGVELLESVASHENRRKPVRNAGLGRSTPLPGTTRSSTYPPHTF